MWLHLSLLAGLMEQCYSDRLRSIDRSKWFTVQGCSTVDSESIKWTRTEPELALHQLIDAIVIYETYHLM
uniref:Putative secreted protein n=1 Tax=Anopheles marajoara TaxID=58244 RepID=A0A2M4CEQ2_9DIPT